MYRVNKADKDNAVQRHRVGGGCRLTVIDGGGGEWRRRPRDAAAPVLIEYHTSLFSYSKKESKNAKPKQK